MVLVWWWWGGGSVLRLLRLEKVMVRRREQAREEPHPRMSDASQKATGACRNDVGD